MTVRWPRVAITAAGASSRMGGLKALLPWNGRPLIEHMIASSRRAGLERIVVVTGAGREQIEPVAAGLGVDRIHNAEHAEGRFSSVRLAARWAAGGPLLLWPVDCPAVGASTLGRLAHAALLHPEASIVPLHGGHGGHPVVLPAAVVATLAAAEGDGNLRDAVRRAPGGRVMVEVSDSAVLDNLNTPHDYRRFLETRPLPAQTPAGMGVRHG